jgi:hypothetical protein
MAPLFQKHCPGVSSHGRRCSVFLGGLEEVTSHAEMIREVVVDRRMPPWYGHRQHSFANERGLSPQDGRQIAAWVQAKMPAGDPAKAPPPRTFADSKWEIGEPT